MNKLIPLLKGIYKNYKKIINPIAVLLVVLLIPLLIDYCIIGNKFPSNIDNSDWVSFLGSYIGAFCTLIGIWWTIRFTREQAVKDRDYAKEQAKKDRDLAREMALEERSYQNEPKLLVNLKSKSQFKENAELYLFYDGDDHTNMDIVSFLSIKNIGLGPALNICITNINYKDKELNIGCQYSGLEVGQEVVIKFDLSMCLESFDGDGVLKKWKGPFKSRSEKSHNKSGKMEFDIEYNDLFGDSYYFTFHVKSQISILCWFIEEENEWMFADVSVFIPQVSTRRKISISQN
jgi:hypothetical protein